MAIKRVGSDIYFYSHVNSESSLEFAVALKEANTAVKLGIAKSQVELLNAQLVGSQNISSNITLHIQSYGGDLLAGFGMMGLISSCKFPTTSVVEGYAASAATILSVAAKHDLLFQDLTC